MNSLTKKMIISVLTLIITVGAFAATTFAWFTLGNQATIGQIEAEIETTSGLEVSVDGLNWYNALPKSVINEEVANKTLKALTSTNGVSFSTVTNLQNSTPTTTPASEGFITLTLLFRSAKTGSVKLSDLVFGGNDVTIPSDVAFTGKNGAIAQGGNVVANPKDAARISLTNLTSTSIFQAPADATNTISVGFADAHSYYFAKTLELLGNVHDGNDFTTGSQVALDNSLAAIEATFEDVLVFDADATDAQFSFALVKTGDFWTASVNVNIWIEGWDSQAYNFIQGLPLTFDMKFELVA